jgi:cardiolipin synthase
MKKRHPKYRFPWREGNQFKLLVDGDQFFPPMLDAIHAARKYILMEMYLFESGVLADRVISAMVEAAKRGVKVYLLLDDIGSRGLSKEDRVWLVYGNVNLAFYNPIRYRELRHNMFRDHKKLLVVDGEVAYTGGAGVTDNFWLAAHPCWRETMVEARGEVVQDWQWLFKDAWDNIVSPAMAVTGLEPCSAKGEQLGRVTYSQRVHLEIKRSFFKRLGGVERRAWIATPYFVPTRKMRRFLRKAAKNGVDVRLLLPGPITDHPAVRYAGRRFYTRLLRNSVRIFEYQPRFIHAKVILCDNWVSIGSSNMDRWGLRWNLEANQEIDDRQFAEQVYEMFIADFHNCTEINFEYWSKRPWHRRFLEWFWGYVDWWLQRYSR